VSADVHLTLTQGLSSGALSACWAAVMQVRASRSSELLGQCRRVQQHMQSQSNAVKQQSSKFDESVQRLRADMGTWKAKLLNYEKLLSNSLSLKGLDVTWREGLALKTKLDKQLHEASDDLHAWVSTSCAAVSSANRRFEAELLKPFAGELLQAVQ